MSDAYNGSLVVLGVQDLFAIVAQSRPKFPFQTERCMVILALTFRISLSELGRMLFVCRIQNISHRNPLLFSLLLSVCSFLVVPFKKWRKIQQRNLIRLFTRNTSDLAIHSYQCPIIRMENAFFIFYSKNLFL